MSAAIEAKLASEAAVAVAAWATTGAAPDPWPAESSAAARWAMQVYGVAPLLHQRLIDGDTLALPAELRVYLARQHLQCAERNALLLGELREMLLALDSAGIAVMPLKGCLLAERYYAAPGLRPMNDLDLLVRPDHEQRAVAVLRELRWEPVVRGWKHLELARPGGRGPVVDWTGDHPDNPRGLDLHTRLQERFWGIRFDMTADAWAACERGELQGAPALVLQPWALLQHLAVHATGDAISRRLRLIHLIDIALVAPELGEQDWQRIVDGAQQRREQRYVYPTLALAMRHGAAIPAYVLEALRSGLHDELARFVDTVSLEQLSYCNSAPTTIGEKMIWFRPGSERLRALRHMALPDPLELGHWYPRLARPALLPLAYARYGAEMAGWAVRRILGGHRLRYGEGSRPAAPAAPGQRTAEEPHVLR